MIKLELHDTPRQIQLTLSSGSSQDQLFNVHNKRIVKLAIGKSLQLKTMQAGTG